MVETANKSATYDDLLAVPEHLVAEIVHGQLYTTPRPAPRHARASSSLGGELFNPYDRGRNGPGGWIILDEPELHLGEHVLVPDLAGWRRERLPELPETAWFELSPDWVCEVLSPSTASLDRSGKMPIYAESGVPWLWLIDPEVKTLEAYELREGRWLLLKTLSDHAEVALPPFDAVPFPLEALWG
ncbi:Uma2 family endonuclease [Thiolapillus sp.]